MSRNTPDRLSRRDTPQGYIVRGSQHLRRTWSLLLILALALSLAPMPSAVVNAATVPTLSIDDVTQAEGTMGNTTFVFTVSLSAATTKPVKVSYRTANGTATAGSDFNAVQNKLTIPGGQTSRTIAVTVRGDAIAEPDETFGVILSNPSAATLADGQGVGTILNDDDDVPPGQAALSVDDVTVTEGNSGTTTANFTVSLSAPAGPGGVTFDIATQDGTATTANNDYVASTLTAQTIPEGSQTYSFSVGVNGDAEVEPNETFTVLVTNVAGATLADGQGAGTITDDDAPPPAGPTLSINDVTRAEGNSGTSGLVFTVTLAPVTNKPVQVDYATADDTATAGSDYQAASGTLTFRGGETSKTITVLVNGDTAVEPNETFVVNLANASNASIGDNQGVGTIQTDDNQPPAAANDGPYPVDEGGTLIIDAPGVLANDNDAESDPLTVAAPRPVMGTTAGTLTLNADGSFTYVHDGSETTGDSFTYTANDGFNDSNAATVGIMVTPVNDAPTATSQAVMADEDTAELITLAGTDPENSPLNFTITSLPPNGTLFQGNSTAATHEITTLPASVPGNELTYLPDRNYANTGVGSDVDSFQFTAGDGALGSAPASVSLTVNPVNDAPTADATSATTDQNEAVTVTLSGSDLETCNLTFAIVDSPDHGSVDAMTNPACVSGVPNTDSATVIYTPAADYIGPDSFTYKVTDSGGSTLDSAAATATLTVRPPNADPVVTPTTFSLAENSANGTSVGTVGATDSDAGQTLTYAITAGDTGGKFAIDSASGAITVAEGAVLDFEGTKQFLLTVTATDDGTPPASGSATITVDLTNVNEAPTDIALSNNSVAENQASGTSVGTFSTTDPDANSTHTYTLVAGTGDTDNGTFTIDGTTLKTAASFDFETQSSYTIRVRSTDGGSLQFEEVFTITVTDANDAPTDITLSNSSVAENEASGTTVGTLSATDAETGQTYTFSLVAGDAPNDNASFTLDGTTLKTAAVFNYETKSSYSIRVQTDDGNGGTFAEALTITVSNVNEAPTDITLSNSSLDENLPAATTVGTLTGVDPDAGQTLTFALVAGDGDTDNGAFTIDGTTLKTAASFDFETKASYSIRVQATDNGTPAQSFATSFTITVNNVNDAPVLAAIEGTALSYTENDAATAVSPGITVSDQDSSTLTGATVTISAGYVNGQDVLAFTNQLGITGSWNAVAGVLTLSGNASLAAYQTALRAVTYANASENPSTAARTISFKVNDGVVDSNVATRSVAVTAVNDAPVNTVPAAQTVNEDTDLTLSGASLISSADVDAGTNAVKLSLDVAHGTLTLASTSGLTFVDGTANTSGSVHVTGTMATINTALNGLKYKGALNYNGADSLAVVTNDQGNTGTGGALSDSDSVAITVNAVNDAPTVTAPAAFTIHANMQRTGLTGLLANVTDVDSGVNGCSPTFTVTNVSATTPANGTITNLNAATGTFDFDPPAGFTGGPVTFTYTVTDNGCPGTATSAPATVTFNVSGPVIWFVDDSAAAGGTGRLSAPFNTLAAAGTAIGSSTGHRVFLYDGTYSSGLTLNTNGWLIGQGVTGTGFDTFMGITPPASTLARPSIGTGTATIQGTVTLASSTTVKGFAIASGAAESLADPLAAITGVSVDQVAVTTTTGTGVNLSNIAGTLSFTSLTTNGGTGANLTGSNASATFTFTGVSISSGANPGFVAIGGGTVNITGSANTLATTTGTALNVTNTAIGSGGHSFRSISVNGAVNGIVLNNTGLSGGLTVTGTGAVNSGGTIQNTTGAGISLTNTRGPSFNNVRIVNTGGSGVVGTQVVNFTFTNGAIDNSGTAGAPEAANIAFNTSTSFLENNVSGTVTITGNTLSKPHYHGVDIFNWSGLLDYVNVSNNVITAKTGTSRSQGSAIRLIARGTTSSASVTRANLDNNTVQNGFMSVGIQAQGGHVGTGPAVTFGTPGSATNVISISGNTLTATLAEPFNAEGIVALHNHAGQANFRINNNGTSAKPIGSTIGTAISNSAFGNVTVTSEVKGNYLTPNNMFGSQGIGVGISNSVTGLHTQATDFTVAVENNVIRQTDGAGILAVAIDASGLLKIAIRNNDVGARLSSGGQSIVVRAGSTNGDNDVCLDISGNTSAPPASGPAFLGIGLRKQGASSTVNAFGIKGMSDTSSPGVETYVNGLNPNGGGTLLVSATSGFTNCSSAP